MCTVFRFLNKFFLDTKKKHFLIRRFNLWNYNFLNYKNYKVISSLLLLINQFQLVDHQKVLLLGNRFNSEVFIKKWFFVFIFSFITILFLI